ncbi:MAG: lipid A-modifier LpxR family protein, partial [Planctomycetota bacterium]
WEFDLVDGESFGLRVVPILGASAGNYFTGASAGAYAEWGWNLPGTVGDLNLRQGVDPVGLIATANSYDSFSLSAFAGGGGFAVGHYLPLDGTLFSDSRSVEPEPLVGFLTGGLSLRNGSFALNYFLTFFSERFETEQDNSDFGRVTLSFAF